jgi:hypothetical protein
LLDSSISDGANHDIAVCCDPIYLTVFKDNNGSNIKVMAIAASTRVEAADNVTGKDYEVANVMGRTLHLSDIDCIAISSVLWKHYK